MVLAQGDELNGAPVSADVEARVPLLDYLRELAGLTGTKTGCNERARGACGQSASRSRSRIQGRASSTRLKGVSIARRKRVKPPWCTTSRSRASPAWAPRHNPTSCERDAGVQTSVDTP